MGMFDTITFNCPNCREPLEAQSKGGDCILNTYDHTAVPLDVATDANRHSPIECDCGSKWKFREVSQEVCLIIERYSKDG